MTKQELRQLYKRKRKALSDDEVFQYSKQIFHHFIQEFKPKKGDKIHVFLTIETLREIDTSFFIDYCFDEGIEVYVPKVKEDELYAIHITPETLYSKNKWNIVEPIADENAGVLDYDYVLTPLLYADVHGNRVGYGKGFYDGFFDQLASTVKKVGLNYFEPSQTIDDVWKNDIPLDYLVTPNRVLSFIGCGK